MHRLPVQKLFIIPVLIAALVIRLQGFSHVFSSIVVFRGFDPYYHMRIVELMVKTGQRPERDYFVAYPHSASISIPPLFQYVIAAPGYLLGFEAAEIFAAFLPVILGLISVFLVYLIGKKIFDNEYFASLSALFFALSPGIVNISSLGFTDYHVWVLTLFLAATYFALNKNYQILLSGVFLTLLAFSWKGAPIYAAVLALSLFMYRSDERELQLSSAAFAIPVLSFVTSSFMSFAFLVLALFLFVGTYAKKRGWDYYYLGVCLAVILIVYFIPSGQLPILKHEFSRLEQGIDFILGRTTNLPIIVEAKSFELYGIIESAGYFVFILALPALVWRNKFLITWFASALVLALFQVRFTDILTIAVALLGAYTVIEILQRSGYDLFGKLEEDVGSKQTKNKKKNKNKSKQNKKDEEPLTGGDIAFVGIFIGFILAPSLIFSVTPPFEMTEDWQDSLLWLKENTAEVPYLNTDEKPEYSVLTWKEYGNWIFYVAKRPTIVGAGSGSVLDSAQFFTAQNESDAMKVVEEGWVRYVVTSEEMALGNETTGGKFKSIMEISGLEPDFMGRNETEEFYNNSVFYQLHHQNAINLSHFELVKSFNTVKIFRVEDE